MSNQLSWRRKIQLEGGLRRGKEVYYLVGFCRNLTCFCSLSTISPTSALKVKERPLVLIGELFLHCMENIDIIWYDKVSLSFIHIFIFFVMSTFFLSSNVKKSVKKTVGCGWGCGWWRAHIGVLQFSSKLRTFVWNCATVSTLLGRLSTRFWNLAAGIFSHLSTRALARLGHWHWVIKPGSFKPCFFSLSWRWWIRLRSGIHAHLRSLPPGNMEKNVSLWTLLCAQGHCHVE